MTIVPKSERISGELLHGFQISCDTCKGSNFLHSKKHLPPEVVAEKYRQRGWEVNANGKDFCPNCIVLKRGRKPGTKIGSLKERRRRIIPAREIEFLNDKAVAKVLTGCGLAFIDV